MHERSQDLVRLVICQVLCRHALYAQRREVHHMRECMRAMRAFEILPVCWRWVFMVIAQWDSSKWTSRPSRTSVLCTRELGKHHAQLEVVQATNDMQLHSLSLTALGCTVYTCTLHIHGKKGRCVFPCGTSTILRTVLYECSVAKN